MASIINNNVEISPYCEHELGQKFGIGLVTSEDRSFVGFVGPFVSALGVVFDVVKVDVWEVFKPGIIGSPRTVSHVTSKPDFQHLDLLIAEGGQTVLIHAGRSGDQHDPFQELHWGEIEEGMPVQNIFGIHSE